MFVITCVCVMVCDCGCTLLVLMIFPILVIGMLFVEGNNLCKFESKDVVKRALLVLFLSPFLLYDCELLLIAKLVI